MASNALTTAGRFRFVASDRTGRPWITLIVASWRPLNGDRFMLTPACGVTCAVTGHASGGRIAAVPTRRTDSQKIGDHLGHRSRSATHRSTAWLRMNGVARDARGCAACTPSALSRLLTLVYMARGLSVYAARPCPTVFAMHRATRKPDSSQKTALFAGSSWGSRDHVRRCSAYSRLRPSLKVSRRRWNTTGLPP